MGGWGEGLFAFRLKSKRRHFSVRFPSCGGRRPRRLPVSREMNQSSSALIRRLLVSLFANKAHSYFKSK